MNTMLMVLVCALIATVSCEPDEKFMEMRKQCIADSGATEEMVMNTMNGVFSTDVALAKFFVCLGKRSGMLDDEGNIDKALLKKGMMRWSDDEAAVGAAVEKCSDKKATLEETAIESTKCLYNELHK